ncbi:Hypothetical predicted protein [Paramuricea clavata]|uniref:Uncharacterized protein n=1 Tax=Paramuricea clavata TaxID=317549 RepID=A0A6S7JII7_PARCT|nr:Hypothetical predicted protein [Paramuricea clavata]
MKRMRTAADSDSATSENDVENSYNTDNEVEIDSVSESDSDNVDDTSSEVGDESEPWAPLKAEAAQQSLSEFEELTQNFTAEGYHGAFKNPFIMLNAYVNQPGQLQA